MKIKRSLVVGCLTTLLGLGAAVGAGFAAEKAPVKEAQAASKTFYFIAGPGWDKDSATFKIDFRDSGGGWLNKRYSMTKQTSYKTAQNETVYTYTASDSTMSGVGKLCFGRFSSDGNTEWNYSSVLDYDGTNLYYRNTSSDAGNPSISKSDSFPDRIVVNESSTPSSSTGRVFVNNYGSGWTDGNIGVRCWGGSATSTSGSVRYGATIYCTNWFQDKTGDDQSYYGWIDIPTNVNGFQFVKLSAKSTTADIWNYQNGDSFTVSDGCFSYIYYASNGWSSGADISKGGAKNDKAYSTLLSRVIESYDTCENSTLNGYGAYGVLNTNIFSHAQAGETSATVTSLNGLSKTIAEHIAGMSSRYSSSSSKIIPMFGPLSDVENSSNVILIIILSSVTLLGVGGFFFIKRRKHDR